MIDAEQVGVRTIDTLTQRDADLRHRDLAGLAKRKQIIALDVMRAGWKGRVVFTEAVYAASHENVVGMSLVRLDLLQAFVDPVNAIAAVDHRDCLDSFRRRAHSALLVCLDRAIPSAPAGTSSVMQLPAAT